MDLYLQLLLFLVTAAGIAFFLSILHPVKQQFEATIPLEFELFWLELESQVTNARTIEGGIQPCVLRLATSDGTYLYEKYGSILRKRKNNLGHEPVLQHIQSCELRGTAEQIYVKITFSSGEVKERRMFVAPIE